MRTMLQICYELFIRYIFMDSLLCTRYYSRHWVTTMNKTQAIVSTITRIRMKEAHIYSYSEKHLLNLFF